MENILEKLLVMTDTEKEQASKEMNYAMKSPDAIPALFNIAGSSQNPEIRKYAAVILRRKLRRREEWLRISPNLRKTLKQEVLKTVVSEQKRSVKSSIAKLVDILVKHEVPHKTWPEFLQFIQDLCSNKQTNKEQMYTLSVITEVTPDQFLTHSKSLGLLFTKIITSEILGSTVAYYAILTMINILPVFEDSKKMMKVYQNLLPRIIQSVQAMAGNDDAKACDMLKLFEEMIGNPSTVISMLPHLKPLVEMCLELAHNSSLDVSLRINSTRLVFSFIRIKKKVMNMCQRMLPDIMNLFQGLIRKDEAIENDVMEVYDEVIGATVISILPHIKPLLEMCLEFACNLSLDESMRVKSINLILWIVIINKKVVLKNNLIPSVIGTLFQLMCLPPDFYNLGDSFIATGESNTPVTCATQVLHSLALNLPPEKIFTPLMCYLQPGLEGEDVLTKTASYLAIAVTADGCSEYIRDKYLKSFLSCICKGILHEVPIVRNTAFYALEQFSQHLQPDFGQHASELLPLLIDHVAQILVQLQEDSNKPQGFEHVFYALEQFCKDIESKIVPYLPILMEHLFAIISCVQSAQARQLALSVISAAATAAKEGMVQYLPQIIAYLRAYLSSEEDDEKTIALKIQALDTLGTLAETIGDEHFKELVQESVKIGMNFINDSDEPDLRKAAFGLFASLASTLKEEMRSVLPSVVKVMIESLKYTEDLVRFDILKTNYKKSLSKEEDFENESGDDSDDDNIQDSLKEEKEEACLALREIARHAGIAFLPHLEICFKEVLKLLEFPHNDVRLAAVGTLSQFCIALSKLDSTKQKSALFEKLAMFIPKCVEIICMDEDGTMVVASLRALCELLNEVKAPVVEGKGHQDAIINCLKDIMTFKTEFQEKDEEDTDSTEEDSVSEQDEFLLKCAGDILPALSKAMHPASFEKAFNLLLPPLSNMLVKKSSSYRRTFVVGALAECVPGLGSNVKHFVQELLSIFLTFTQDENGEVRKNSVFGIGQLAQYGREAVFSHYPEILTALSNTFSQEEYTPTLDNVCGAIARLILTNISGVPMDQVFPMFVKYLPLRIEFQENKAVFECLLHLHQLGHQQLITHIQPILEATFKAIHKKQGSEEILYLALKFVKLARCDFPEEFNKSLAAASQEVITTLQNI